eukprot:1160142-Pelagomonas_calceolata.AAC.36
METPLHLHDLDGAFFERSILCISRPNTDASLTAHTQTQTHTHLHAHTYTHTHVGDEQKAGEKDDGHFWPGAISEHVVKAELAKHGLPQREDGAPKIPGGRQRGRVKKQQPA